jgi:hypothetical protein
MRREYDFASMSGGVRGKYAGHLKAGGNLIVLDEDVAKAFPTSAAVNEALRALLQAASHIRGSGKPRARRPAKSVNRPDR